MKRISKLIYTAFLLFCCVAVKYNKNKSIKEEMVDPGRCILKEAATSIF